MEECNVNETFHENMLNQSRITILRSSQPKYESKLLDLRKKNGSSQKTLIFHSYVTTCRPTVTIFINDCRYTLQANL